METNRRNDGNDRGKVEDLGLKDITKKACSVDSEQAFLVIGFIICLYISYLLKYRRNQMWKNNPVVFLHGESSVHFRLP